MIRIDSAIQARAMQNLQTIAGNNNPTMRTIVSRPRTPIVDKRLWQEIVVQGALTAICTSVAIRKTDGKDAGKVFASFVTDEGSLIVKSANIVFPLKNIVWVVEETISACVACSIEFEGRFVHSGLNVEYYTDSLPFLFYTNTSGELWAGIIGEEFEQLAASGATAIDVVRGVASIYEDVNQGLIVFYIQNGSVFYRQWIDGVWQGQQTVSIAPANAVAIKVERLFDYRICLQVKDATGALYEVFTKMEASGWNGTEFVSVGISQTIVSLPIKYIDSHCCNDHISMGISQIVEGLYALSPVMVSAINVDDGTGNYGRIVELTWDERIFGESTNAGAFVLTDSVSGAWGGLSVVKSGKKLIITMQDFNNAVNPVTLTYTPGTLMGDVVAVVSDSISFTATGLVPITVTPPALVSIENIQEWEVL